MRTGKLLLLVFVPVVLVLLLTPFLARWDTTKEVARWSSTNAVYGIKRPIWLGIHRNVAYVDIFSSYPSYSLFVTDGGYGYLRTFDIPSTDFKSYLARCQVNWKPDGAELLTPDGERLFIPGQSILRQIGATNRSW
jgi:hypothetical protein